jgi:UV DNA damage endonuclease
MFPWMSEYELKDMPTYSRIKTLLEGIGQYVKKYNHRLTFHPGAFCVLASLNPRVVTNSIKELNQHGEIMDIIGLPRNHWSPINIHVNTAQGGKEDAMQRFCKIFPTLDESVKSRLVVENDDKKAQYSVKDLKEGVSDIIGCPVMFDYHHHWCYEDPMPVQEAFELARSTWPEGIRQCTHYSSCRKLHEDSSVMNRAHADYIYEPIPTFGYEVDVELEAKAKELAVLKYKKDMFDRVALEAFSCV